MTDAEFDAWLPSVRVGYAEELILNGSMDPADAKVKADAATAELFPGGQPSPQQLVFVIEAGGERVGELWLTEREEQLRRVLWVYELGFASSTVGAASLARRWRLSSWRRSVGG